MNDAAPRERAAPALRALWRWVRRGLQALLFCAVMVVLAFFIEPLKGFDWALAERLAPAPRPWPAQVELVDLKGSLDPQMAGEERASLHRLLCLIAAQRDRPAAVLLSFALPPWPGEAQSALAAPCEPGAAVGPFESLKARGVALLVPPDNAQRDWVRSADDWRERSGGGVIFQDAALFGHGELTLRGHYYWYRHCVCVGGSCDFPALPVRAREVLLGLAAPTEAPCDPHRQTVARIGQRDSVAAHRWSFDGTSVMPAQAGRTSAEWAGRILVLGHLGRDFREACVPRSLAPDAIRACRIPRAELLGWAVGDGLPSSALGDGQLRLLDDPGWAVVFAMAFAAFAAAGFELLAARLKPLHRWLHVAALGSALGAVAALGLTILLLLQVLNVLYFQASYVLVGIALATWLSWRQMAGRLRDQALYTDVSQLAPGDGRDYDVFVSYSHTPKANIAWVREQVVQPLTDRGLTVFFDETSIRVGMAWYFELASGIQRSRCLVAICSDDYFAKGFCRFELSKAMARQIGAGGSFTVLPYLTYPAVSFPVEFNHLQYVTWPSSDTMTERVLEVLDAARRQAPA